MKKNQMNKFRNACKTSYITLHVPLLTCVCSEAWTPLPGMACTPPCPPPHPASQDPGAHPAPQHHTSAQQLLAGRRMAFIGPL